MKIKVKELNRALEIVQKFVNNKTKFGYACSKNYTLIKEALSDIDKKLDEAKVELALVGNSGEILFTEDGKNYKYSKENYQKLINIISEYSEKEIDYVGYIASDYTEVKDDLYLLNTLNGIVVNVDIESLYNV